MFTGLIEAVGTVRSLERSSQDWRITLGTAMPLGDVKLGDSIAVSGVCLTVVTLWADAFAVDASAETVARTTFGDLTNGRLVNLERAMQVGGRLDGHLVQGHVDAVGRVERIAPRGRSVEIWFRVPASPGRYIVEKGSIAVDGVSLTVNALEEAGAQTRFSVNIIPHTQKKTTLAELAVGSGVNIETDLIGRYVERLLKGGAVYGTGGPTGGAKGSGGGGGIDGIDEQWLRERGFA